MKFKYLNDKFLEKYNSKFRRSVHAYDNKGDKLWGL